MELIANFHLEGNCAYLDSALYYIDEVYGKCEGINLLLTYRKLGIFSLQCKFSEAIELISAIDEKSFGEFKCLKEVLSDRFKAMQAQNEGDTLSRELYLKSMVQRLTSVISSNKEEIDKIISDVEIADILNNPYATVFMQLYYYKAQLFGVDDTMMELDALQKSLNGNNDFFDAVKGFLNEDFMIFSGV